VQLEDTEEWEKGAEANCDESELEDDLDDVVRLSVSLKIIVYVTLNGTVGLSICLGACGSSVWLSFG
jgi:hypothetical protein